MKPKLRTLLTSSVLLGLTLLAVPSGFGQELPVIVEHPQGVIVPRGTTVSFTVRVEGTEPISYRWRKNMRTIVGETNATLVITNAMESYSYSVAITSPYGLTISRFIPLSFFEMSRGEDGLGLDLYGVPGPQLSYELQAVTNALSTNWMTLTNFNLTNYYYRYVDPGTGNTSQRFYRAVSQPWFN